MRKFDPFAVTQQSAFIASKHRTGTRKNGLLAPTNPLAAKKGARARNKKGARTTRTQRTRGFDPFAVTQQSGLYRLETPHGYAKKRITRPEKSAGCQERCEGKEQKRSKDDAYITYARI
jgi:hypothetical protein